MNEEKAQRLTLPPLPRETVSMIREAWGYWLIPPPPDDGGPADMPVPPRLLPSPTDSTSGTAAGVPPSPNREAPRRLAPSPQFPDGQAETPPDEDDIDEENDMLRGLADRRAQNEQLRVELERQRRDARREV